MPTTATATTLSFFTEFQGFSSSWKRQVDICTYGSFLFFSFLPLGKHFNHLMVLTLHFHCPI